MKKIFLMSIFAIVLGLSFTSCGDDEPVVPIPQTANLESVYENETETHFMFDIDMAKDSSSIYMYNVVFHIGEATSPAMTLRVDAPVTADQTNKVYTYAGTGIVAYMQRGGTWLPMPGEAYLVNNLKCTVNTSAKTYDIAFDCHGGHFAESGKLK